jgi:L-iditol 2-dehydrogenase
VCGSDIPRILTYGAYISPIIPGHEFAGEIVEIGSEVTGFKPGDHVTVPPLIPCFKCHWCEQGEYSLCEKYDYYGSRRNGAFAQYIAVKQGNLLKVADSVPFEDAATTDPCANALHGMARAGFKAGDSVLIYGAGPIGLFALQYAKLHGASRVVAVDVGEKKLDLARKAGADAVIDGRDEDVIARVKDETNGLGADIVIDFTGVPACQLNALHCASKMGTVVLLGISHKGLNLGEKEVDQIMRKQLTLRGSWNSFGKPFPGHDWTYSVELFEKGLTAKDIISHRLTLDEAPDMFRRIAQGEFFSKVMFFPWGIE